MIEGDAPQVLWTALAGRDLTHKIRGLPSKRNRLLGYVGAAWTGAHDRWLRTEAAPQLTALATRMAFAAADDHVLTVQARRGRLDTAIEEMAADSEFTPVVRRMCCLRGVSTLTGFALAVEIGDWNRFTGNTIGSFVGLVPSEYSSGASRVQGAITRTGNNHTGGCPGPLRRGQLFACTPGGWVPRTPQAPAGGERGHRPRACRLVLIPGGHERLTVT
ncbi:transposase [Rhodococcus sp. NPDC003318]|uniref:transposase n=1 Tax=Rhodococcus sp. NPDC003318 TaxID=3364503 RepID=UPI0036C9D9B4